MALIKCPDCGKMFSEYADCCPVCGCPVAAAKSGILEEPTCVNSESAVNNPPLISDEPLPYSRQPQQPFQSTPTVSSIKCPVCGKMLSEYADCCPKCGWSAEDVTTKKQVVEQKVGELHVDLSEKKSKGFIIAIVILSLVVAGLVTAFVVMRCFDNSDNSDNDTSSTEIQQSSSEEGNIQSSYSDNETRYDYVCERYVRDSDLIGLSKEELRIMRNWIFARHGYVFKSEDLQEYFGQFSWYYPRYADVTNMLSDIEITNIDYIKRYE